MTIPDASATHRQKGNEAFRSANYAEAAASYTVALAEGALQPTLDGDLKEHLAAIFSNRAAARINLFELDLGMSVLYHRFVGPLAYLSLRYGQLYSILQQL